MLDITAYEELLHTAFSTHTVLNFGRPVRYSNERKGQPGVKYLTVQAITSRQIGAVQQRFTNQEGTDDLLEQKLMPVEITFDVQFRAGNARGELSLAIISAGSDIELQKFFLDGGMSFSRTSDIRDITEAVGGQMEQAGQVDMIFSAFIMPDEIVTPAIRSVALEGELKNQKDEAILTINPVITPEA